MTGSSPHYTSFSPSILADIINRNRAVYTAATTNRKKKEITERLRLEIGGRFVRVSKGELNKGIAISKEEARIKIAQSLQYHNRKCQDKEGTTSPTKQRSNSHTDRATEASTQSGIPKGVDSNGAIRPTQPAPVYGVHNSPYIPTSTSYPSALASFAASGNMQWTVPPRPPPPPPPIPVRTSSFRSLPTSASVAPDTVNQPASNPFSSMTTTTVVSNEEIRWALGVSSVPPPEIASQLGISNNSQHSSQHNSQLAAETEQQLGDDSEDTAIGVAFTDL
jgi:hypothetical protein